MRFLNTYLSIEINFLENLFKITRDLSLRRKIKKWNTKRFNKKKLQPE